MKTQQAVIANKQRLVCSVCDYRVDPNNESAFATFPCRIRALMDEQFKVWRCPDCGTIHCLEFVDLDYYYSKYPFEDAQLVWPLRIFYGNLCRQLTKHGFSKHHSFLDYGCGKHGLFVQYLQEKGFTNARGYDPYAPEDGLGNKSLLQPGTYDFVSSQDVIEHVEDPNAFLNDIDRLVAPGGYILIGTPNADGIALDQPNVDDHCFSLHVPYHLHIYTRETLESLGRNQGWEPVTFFDRKYDDTLWFCLNNRAVNAYMSVFDGSMDILGEPLQLGKAFTSPKFILQAFFGYWLSFHAGMGVMFRKERH